MRGRMRALGLAAVLALALSGCGGTLLLPYAREIDEMALMRTMGVDLGAAGGVTVTASSGVQSQGAEKGDAPPTVVQGAAGTISGAVLRMQEEGTSYLYFGHVGQLLLGETLAGQGVSPSLEYVLRDVEMRLDTGLYLAKGGEAGAAIAAAARESASSADRLEAMEEDAGLTPRSMPRTVKQVLEDLERNGCSFAPAVSADGALSAAGYGILKDGALAGWAERDAASGVNLLLGQMDADVVELTMEDDAPAALRVVGAKTEVRPVFEGARLIGLHIACAVDANLAEGRPGLSGGDWQGQVEARLAQVEEGRIRAALELAQRLDADYLQLEQAACLASPWHKADIRHQFDLGELTLSVSVTAAVERSYDARA